MKLMWLSLLVLSLALNGVLGWRLARDPSDPDRPTASSRPVIEGHKPTSGSLSWSRLRADGDLAALAANLRAAGFPPDLLRVVLQAAVDAAQVADDLAAQHERGYWRSRRDALWDSAARAEVRHRQLVRLLANLGLPEPEGERREREARYGPVTAVQAQLIDRIERDYLEMQYRTFLADGGLLAIDRERQTLLARERRADLARLLTPLELEEYELRTSPTALRLRATLAAFAPNAAEFRALFRAARPVDVERALLPGALSRPELYQADQLRAALGESRFTEFLEKADPGFSPQRAFAARLELAPSTAVTLSALHNELADDFHYLQAGSPLAAAQRDTLFRQRVEATRARLQQLLGPAACDAYLRDPAGRWLADFAARQIDPP
jgi:hypothetical protein